MPFCVTRCTRWRTEKEPAIEVRRVSRLLCVPGSRPGRQVHMSTAREGQQDSVAARRQPRRCRTRNGCVQAHLFEAQQGCQFVVTDV